MNGMAKDFAKRRVSFKLPQIILQKAPEITLSEQTIVEASRPLYQTKLRSLNLSPGPISANSMGKSPEETESRVSLLTPPEQRHSKLTSLPPIRSSCVTEMRPGTGESGSDDGYDTELEDVNEDVLDNKPERCLKSCEELYLGLCEKENIAPSWRFLRECETECVSLPHYGLGDKGVRVVAKVLEQNLFVNILNLFDNGIGPHGAQDLSRMLSVNCFITHMNLSGNMIRKEGIIAIGIMLQESASLVFLNLAKCGINGKDMMEFCKGIATNPHLKSLIFHSNNLSDQGSRLLSEALASNTALETLDLSWNDIRPGAMATLAKGLRLNHTIQELDLSWNTFQSRGVIAVQWFLTHSTSLQTLDISNCGIHLDGAEVIAKVLRANRNLQVLKLGRNPFQNAGVPCILEAVRLNARSSLRELTFDGIGFMKDSERELEALLEDRPSFSCSWSSSIRGSDVSKGFARPDEVVIFMRFVRNMGFRLVDLFKILSPEKQSLSVSKEAFVFGLKRLNAPLRDDQLRVIFDSLDEDGNGTLDFHEFSAMRNHSLAKYVKKNMKKRRSELQKEHIRKIML
ncbi:leucine-rich repeat-containing protein 74B [Nematostella vectensis]|uniref:leucine-rich repeat-containing protein 74B n=1 Tax=Nematostella vectensis TaxID=45351 RepID=UPI0020772785|nr:leucine-rich repeat-containing protein 74B [Nematostella vectensis]XP_048588239.1 leucine-rich repeat-containing protein 74B [Nematostella vectensis]